MNAKILLMTALLGGVSVLSFAGCSSDDDTKNTDNKDDKDAGSTDKDSGGGNTDKDSGGGSNTVDCGGSSCEKACEKAAAAKCGDGDAISKVCEQANTYKSAVPDCADEIDAAIACYNDTATYSCEGGATKASGCDAEYNAVGTCIQAALAGDAGSDAGN